MYSSVSPLLGLAVSFAGKAVLGEVEIPEKARGNLQKVQKQFEAYSELVKDFRPENPVSWARTAVSIAGHLLKENAGVYDSAWEFLKDKDLTLYRSPLPFMADALMALPERRIEFVDDWSVILKVILPNGVPLWIEWQPESAADRKDLYMKKDGPSERKIQEGLSAIFWGDARAVEIDFVNKQFMTRRVDLTEYEYLGPLKQMISIWDRYREQGIRRNILVQGKPGTGKTTFCYEAANRLSDRTLLLTGAFCAAAGETMWKSLMDIMVPEFVVVNDIDRLGPEQLGKRLRMFEEGFCDIPFVLFTSNDLEAFPPAMLRPGRVDQKIVVDEPDDLTCRKIINHMAESVGVEVPVNEMPGLVDHMRELSPAHVKERLRRARVEGWETGDMPWDQTFVVPEEPEPEEKEESVG